MRLTSPWLCLSFLCAACAATGPATREIESSFAPVDVEYANAPDHDASVSLAGPAGSAAARSAFQETAKKKKKEPWINVFGFGSTRELDEITFENDLTDLETDAHDVETTRVGAGVAFGRKNVRGYVQSFFEHIEGQFDIALPDLDADGIGFGGGVMGEPSIAQLGDTVSLIVPYHLDVGLVLANDDDLEVDMIYYDTRLEAGLGIDWNGLQPSVGVRIDTMLGGIEAEHEVDEDAFDTTFTGFNAGGYAGVKYKHPEFPLWFDVSAAFGDVQGVTGTLGFTL